MPDAAELLGTRCRAEAPELCLDDQVCSTGNSQSLHMLHFLLCLTSSHLMDLALFIGCRLRNMSTDIAVALLACSVGYLRHNAARAFRCFRYAYSLLLLKHQVLGAWSGVR